MSLLASQAVVDSKDSEILSADEVDELKRVRWTSLSGPTEQPLTTKNFI